MSRWERPLLLFSIALNIAFVSVAATRSRSHRDDRGEEIVLDGRSSRIVVRDRGPEVIVLDRSFDRLGSRRRAKLDRTLRLDADQGMAFEAGFRRVRPYLRDTRNDVVQARIAYARALERADAGDVRSAQRRLSRAQAQLDSLVAEAMLHEAAVLSPDQRSRYVTWTFRSGHRSRRSMDWLPTLDERKLP